MQEQYRELTASEKTIPKERDGRAMRIGGRSKGARGQEAHAEGGGATSPATCVPAGPSLWPQICGSKKMEGVITVNSWMDKKSLPGYLLSHEALQTGQ